MGRRALREKKGRRASSSQLWRRIRPGSGTTPMHDRTTTIEQKDQGGAMSKGANFLLCRGGSLVSLSLSSLSSFSPGAFPSDIEWRRRMDKKGGGGGGGPPLFTSWPRDNGTCQPRRRRRRRRRRREDRPRNRRGGGVGLDRRAPLPSPAPLSPPRAFCPARLY